MNKILCCLALSLGLISTPALAQEGPPSAPAQAAAPAAPAPDAGPDSRVGTPPPGKAQVVFFRADDALSLLYSYAMMEGDTPVAKLDNNQYYVIVAEPGLHTYQSKWMKVDALTLELDEGETYYVRGQLEMEAIGSRANLSPSDETTFRLYRRLKPAGPPPPPKPSKRKRSKD